MPAPADEPLDRAFINLYRVDKAEMYRRYGHGWSEVVRKLVRDHLRETTPKEIKWPLNPK